MKDRNVGIIMLVLTFAAVFAIAATSPGQVYATSNSCTAQISASAATYYYYNSNIGLTVPVSTTCSFSGGQLYSVGYAYDVSTNMAQSSANTMLTWISGNTYRGQLGFKLSPTLLGHTLQISVSIYGPSSYSPSAYYAPGNFPGCDTASMACNYGIPYPNGGYGYGQANYGQLLTSVSETVQINAVNFQNGYPTSNPTNQHSYYGYGYPQSCGYYQGCTYQGAYCSSSNPNCYYNGNPGAEYCQSLGAYCDFTYNVCQNPNSLSNQAQCSGYLYQPQNGCLELEVPVNSPVAAQVYQYYTLNNMPASYPPLGSWVTVTGNIYQGSTGSSNYNAACPGNYINVSSIS